MWKKIDIDSGKIKTIYIIAALIIGFIFAKAFLINFDLALIAVGGFSVLLYLIFHQEYIFFAGILALPLTRIGTLRIDFFTLQPSQFFGVILFYLLLCSLTQRNKLNHFFNIPLVNILLVFLAVNFLSLVQTRFIPIDYEFISHLIVSSRNKPFVKSLTQIIWMIVGIIWYFNTYYFIKTRKELNVTLKALLWSASITGLFGIYQFVGYHLNLPGAMETLNLAGINFVDPSARTGQFVRVSSFYTEPGQLAVFFICSLPLIASISIFKNSFIPSKSVKLFFFAAIFSCFVMTLSRSTIILGIYLIGALYLARRTYNLKPINKLFSKVLISILLCTIVIEIGLRVTSSIGLEDILIAQFQSLFAPTEENISNLQRLGAWITAWNMFLDHPILGVGIGNYIFHIQNYSPDWLQINDQTVIVNNIYLETLCETGLIGLSVLIFFIYRILKSVHIELKSNLIDNDDRVILTSLLIGFGGLVVGHLLLSAFYYPMIWIYIGIMLAYLKILKTEKTPVSPI